MAEAEPIVAAFLASLGTGLHLAPLFDALPEIYFYAKDRQGRLVAVNDELVALRGCASERDLLGRTDYDLHPRHLADRYVAEDRLVMETRKPLPNRVWLIPDIGGGLRWFLSTKVPLLAHDGSAAGVAGMFRDLRKFETAYKPHVAMDAALRRILDDYPEPLKVSDLATSAGLSVSQFDRRFKAAFGATPREYLLRVRIDAASYALATTGQAIAEVAQACGFYDQSSFGKLFRRQTGMTPRDYRRKYANEPARPAPT